MATERIRTVKSSAGDYASWSAWLTGETGVNLTSLDEIRTAEIYSFVDTTAVTINGFSGSDATRFVKAIAPLTERHNGGGWTSGKQNLSATNAVALTVSVDFFKAYFLQLELTVSNATDRNLVNIVGVAAGSRTEFFGCIFRKAPGSAGTGQTGGIVINDVDATVICANCQFHDLNQGATATSPRAFDTQSAGGVGYMLSCLYRNCTVGVRKGSNGAVVTTVINCIADSCGDGYLLGGSGQAWGAATDYNISSLSGDAPGTTVKNSSTPTFVSGSDFHLNVTDTVAKGWATDLSAYAPYSFATDIDDAARPAGLWDAGPDQVTTGATPASLPPRNSNRMRPFMHF